MTVGSLFAGIGGFELAAQWAGFTPVWSNEIDPFCCQVLRKNFKHRIIEDDIRNIGKHNLEPVDILTGGFPCQDISIVGKGKGITGERSGLWTSYYSIIDQLRPSYVVIENSTELLKKGFEKVLHPLSEIGYDVEWDCIRADEFGFPHQRNRVFIVAYSNGIRRLGIADIFGRLQKNVPWAKELKPK